MAAKQADGSTLEEHLKAYEYRMRKPHPRLSSAPQLPADLGFLWADFIELHQSRGVGMAGPDRIRYSDIDAYQRVSGHVLAPWQIYAIKQADEAFLRVRAEND